MNDRLLKERRQTAWLILAAVLLAALVFSLPLLAPAERMVQVTSVPAGPLPSAMLPTPAPHTTPQTGGVLLTQPTPAPSPAANSYFIAGVTAGQPAPDFTLNALDGRSLTLSNLRGQAVILNFWASWCYPCRLEMPELERAYQAHAAGGLTVLGINVTTQDTLADAQTFVAEFNPSFPILLDETGDVTTRYGVRGIPTSYFIDRNGIVTHVHLGALNVRQLSEFAAEILAN